MSRLTAQSTPAERRVGAMFAENWESIAFVEDNGGTIGTTCTVANGLLTSIGNTSTDYAEQNFMDLINNGGSVKIEKFCYTGASAAFLRFFEWNLDGDNAFVIAIRPSDGELRCAFNKGGVTTYSSVATGVFVADTEYEIIFAPTGGSESVGVPFPTYVNGVASQDGVLGVGLGTANSKLYVSRLLVGSIGPITVSQGTAMTAQTALDSYNNATYNYPNESVTYLKLDMESHDPTNVRTLDVSGNANHATFGDGSTATTYPTKLSKRGYSFDGTTDYFDGLPALTGSFTVCVLADNTVTHYNTDTVYETIKTAGAFTGDLQTLITYDSVITPIQEADEEIRLLASINKV